METSPEVESKFDVDDDTVLPSLTDLPDVATARRSDYELEATYYDTADLRLAAAGITLRRRTGGHDAGWHLKLPGTGARHEVRVPLHRARNVVPKRLRELLPAVVGDRRLEPVATLRTRRMSHHLVGEDGTELAELSDDRVHADASGTVREWREWELELVDGDRSLLVAVGDALHAAGARPAVSASKIGRALGERTVVLDDEVAFPTSTTEAAATLVQTRLAEQVRELRRRDPLVRLDLPDGVHKMRVATRRLRTSLATFRPFLDRGVTDPLREELKWLGGLLGAARDSEVLRQGLGTAIQDLEDTQSPRMIRGPVRSRVNDELDGRYRDAHASALEALGSERYAVLLERLDALVSTPPWTERAQEPIGTALTGRVRHDWKRLRHRVEALDRADATGSRDARLHEVRKAAKRVRYAAEPLVAAYGDDAARFVKAHKRMQSLLGDHHDSVTARAQLLTFAEEAADSGDDVFTFGVLHERQRVLGARLEARFEDRWRAAARRKRRRWLT